MSLNCFGLMGVVLDFVHFPLFDMSVVVLDELHVDFSFSVSVGGIVVATVIPHPLLNDINKPENPSNTAMHFIAHSTRLLRKTSTQSLIPLGLLQLGGTVFLFDRLHVASQVAPSSAVLDP